jgi:hypothetical protein
MSKLPRKKTARRYGVDTKSITRWEKDESMGFPKPTFINGRAYHDEAELDAFDKRCAERGRGIAQRQGERLTEARRKALHAEAEAGEAVE